MTEPNRAWNIASLEGGPPPLPPPSSAVVESGGVNSDSAVPSLQYEEGSYRSAHIHVPEVPKKEDNTASSITTTTTACPKTSSLSMDGPTFSRSLDATLRSFRATKNYCSVWIHVPMSRSSVIETSDLHSKGFRFHRAEDGVAHLYLWLDEKTEDKIPSYGTHQVGVGAVVVNSRNEILTVFEKHGPSRQCGIKWKIPGGLADLGESLEDAAVREVKEETGIDCEFVSVLGVRHAHGMQFGRSDLYFVCRLDVLHVGAGDDGGENDGESSRVGVIPEPVPQECEIESTEWVPLPDFRRWVDGDDPTFPGGHPMMSQAMKLMDQDRSRDVRRTMMPGKANKWKAAPFYHAPLIASEVGAGNDVNARCNGFLKSHLR